MQSTDDVAGCHQYKKRKKMSARKPQADVPEKCIPNEVEQAKINEIRKLLSPVANKFPCQCSDTSILRFLRARNLNAKKAAKMLKEDLKWRLEYKPEKIQWDDIAQEAETGKIYRANYRDLYGRTVLVMRPGFQNTKSVEGQIKYLVHCMESAISDLDEDVDQMVWLIDFEKWNMSCVSVKVTRETARVLQDHYPERLGIAILYNPPKVFESFWLLVKPFLEHKTYKKIKFVYSDQPQSMKVIEYLFDMDKLEPGFGGKSKEGFDYEAYAKRMKNEEKQKSDAKNSGDALPSDQTSITFEIQDSDFLISDNSSVVSEDSTYNFDVGSGLEGHGTVAARLQE
ncbi:CRAL-TRIO domain-containing protein C23B6.04c [Sesamum alatum]|uniref:CRAL-TRIO domain-containing protein C23B6.04c n=1 Tax=Sesamum alatum TaxID=300844 RepID=A0AAE1XJU7_9LAMI|nr:CRAL-TRIO domain-containing protein C23B6.04c [Sesamum alatum]